MAPAHPSELPGYETRDVSPRGIVLLGAALITVTGVAMLLLTWLFNKMDARAQRADPAVSPLAQDALSPPGPELELNLRYQAFDQPARDQLESYGWADGPQKAVRIPIERAMQILAERGLPETPSTP